MFERTISLEDKGREIAKDFVSQCAQFLGIERDRIKLAFQRINPAEDKIQYTSLLYVNSLTPDANKLYQDLQQKKRVSDKEFIQLLIIEGIWKGLNKKKKSIFTDHELNLTCNTIERLRSFIEKLEKEGEVQDFNSKLQDIRDKLSLQKGEVPNNFVKKIWEKYKEDIEKILSKHKECTTSEANIAEILRDLLLDFPQQSLRTGFTPEIFRKGNRLVISDYLNSLKEREFWDDFKKKLSFSVKSKKYQNCLDKGDIPEELRQGFSNNGILFSQSLRVLSENSGWRIIDEVYKQNIYLVRKDRDDIIKIQLDKKVEYIIREWIEYNIITNLEFYFHAGLTQGDSMAVVFPIFRLREPFGLLYIIINKDREMSLFDSRKSRIQEKASMFISQMMLNYIDKFDSYLMEEFINNLKTESLDELLNGKIRGEDDFKPIFMNVHNKNRLVSLKPFGNSDRYPLPEAAEENKFLTEKWNFRWDSLYSSLMEYYSDLEKIRTAILKHALRSAVAAIMARNMSHNIGSHVLANIAKDVKDLNIDLTLLNVMGNENLGLKDELKNSIYSEFNEYIQGRMDYIARVTSQWASWSFPMDFYLMVVRPFKMNYGLLNNIAKSEGLEIDDLEIVCKINNHVVKDNLTPNCKKSTPHQNSIFSLYHKANKMTSVQMIKCPKCGQELKDSLDYSSVYVEIPEANIGLHAFYSILENFIRNSAKHGKREELKNKEKFKIFIELSEDDKKDHYKVTIYDNLSLNQQPKSTLVEEMEGKIKEKFIDAEGKIEPANWGVREMNISASFLNLKEIQEEENPLDIIKPIPKTVNGREYLGYEFYLRKPKYLMIIDSDLTDETVDEKLGIDTTRSLDEVLRKGVIHKFLLIRLKSGMEQEIIGKIRTNLESLPFRLIVYPEDNEFQLPQEDKILKKRVCVVNTLNNYSNNRWPELFFEIYKHWIKFLDNNINGNYWVGLYLGESSDNEVVKRWKKWENIDGFVKLKVFSGGDELKVPKDSRSILLLRHGGYGLTNKSLAEYKKNALYYESVEKASPIFDLIWNMKDEFTVKLFLYQLLESAVLRILIVDERLSDLTCFEKTGIGDIRTPKNWQPEPQEGKVGIKIPTEVKVADMPDYFLLGKKREVAESMKAESTEAWTSSFYKRCVDFEDESIVYKALNKKEEEEKDKETNFHIISIHKGILEKDSIKEKIGSLKDWIEKVKSCIPFFIIHSGRGIKPGEIPDNARFIEYSTLQQHAYSKLSKFYLSQILLSIGGENE